VCAEETRREEESGCCRAAAAHSARPISILVAFFLSAVRTRLFLHFAQHTPVATTLCSCMIAGESGDLKHVKRNPPHRVLLTTNIIALSHSTLSPMPPIAAPVAKPIYHQDSNGLCASSYSRPTIFRRGNSMCRCHRRVFLLRPDAVATYHRMRALGLSRP
jgi:hypothetical protein